MDIFALIAAFGGGIIGAYMGALPAFIMTGVFALIGGLATAFGVDGGFAIGVMAFGSFVGPHIAFAGGVGAAAYAGRKGKLASGADILSSLNGLGAPDVLVVGGCFGVAGFLIAYLIGMTPLGPLTDLPGITVFVLALLARFIFGKTGLTGKYTGTGKRSWISGGNVMGCNVVLGAGLGIAISFIAASLHVAGNTAALNILPIICFGFSAITLIFTQTGFATPATHHISLPAGLAAVVGVAAWGPWGALLGVAFGVLGAILGDFFGSALNSHVDTHIDPPATTIFLLTIIISFIRIAVN